MRSLTIAVAIAAVAGSAPAIAANDEGGTKLTFGFKTTALYDDNWNLEADPSGGSTQALSTLSLGVSGTSRTQSAGINASIGLQALDISGQSTETGTTNPAVSAYYRARGPSSEFSATAGWTRDDRSLSRTGNLGTATVTRASLGYGFGQDLAFGGNLKLDYNDTDYADVIYTDSRTASADAGLHLDVTPALRLRVGANFRRYTLYDPTAVDTDTKKGTLGATARLNGTDSVAVDVSANRIEEQNGQTADGATGSISYTHAGQVVTTTVSLASAISLQGTRTTLAVNRKHDIQDATLSYGVGVTRDAQDRNNGEAHLEWKQQLRNYDYSVALSHAVDTGSDGNEVLQTAFSAAVKHDLNDTTNVAAKASYSAKDEQNGYNTRDGRASASFGFQLGSDWELSVGAERRMTEDSAGVTASSNSVFATIGRTWVSYR